jgi:acetyl-CoA carboxylase biotin carboxyl carrier protein
MNKIDKKIIDSIDLLSKTMIKNNLSEIEVSEGDFSLKLKKIIKDNQVLKNNEVFEKSTQKENEPSLLEKALKSPLVGTAYLSPDPGAKKFVEVGQNVKIGQVLLIIEAMKTMNEITADKNGVIKKIFVKNESPVEFGEPLFLID